METAPTSSPNFSLNASMTRFKVNASPAPFATPHSPRSITSHTDQRNVPVFVATVVQGSAVAAAETWTFAPTDAYVLRNAGAGAGVGAGFAASLAFSAPSLYVSTATSAARSAFTPGIPGFASAATDTTS
eukprot:14563-Pelagococcus_subviridis.AAC.2